MKAKLAIWVLKRTVKYLKNHPDAIPGHIDNVVIGAIADFLEV